MKDWRFKVFSLFFLSKTLVFFLRILEDSNKTILLSHSEWRVVFSLSFWSSSKGRFPYPYLVTTSLQLLLTGWDRVLFFLEKRKRRMSVLYLRKISKVWRAVCTRSRYVFTAAFWSAITRNSSFTRASCSPRSELRKPLRVLSRFPFRSPIEASIVAQVQPNP